jgi:hypothetical protein
VFLSRGDFDDLQSQLGGFSLEMDDLLFAMLGVIKLGSLVYIFHSVAQPMNVYGGAFMEAKRKANTSVVQRVLLQDHTK